LNYENLYVDAKGKAQADTTARLNTKAINRGG